MVSNCACASPVRVRQGQDRAVEAAEGQVGRRKERLEPAREIDGRCRRQWRRDEGPIAGRLAPIGSRAVLAAWRVCASLVSVPCTAKTDFAILKSAFNMGGSGSLMQRRL